jgi:hypothetical protein
MDAARQHLQQAEARLPKPEDWGGRPYDQRKQEFSVAVM